MVLQYCSDLHLEFRENSSKENVSLKHLKFFIFTWLIYIAIVLVDQSFGNCIGLPRYTVIISHFVFLSLSAMAFIVASKSVSPGRFPMTRSLNVV